MPYHSDFDTENGRYSGGSSWQGMDPWDLPREPRQARRTKGRVRGWMVFALFIVLILGATVALYLISGQAEPEYPQAVLPDLGGAVETTAPPTTVERAQPLGDFTLTLQPQPNSASLSFQAIYSKVIPSIVSIRGTQETGTSLGTGVVVSADGYIITNSHVIEGCSSVDITLWDEREYPAKLVGRDEESDLAVLKIEAQDLTPAEFGDSSSLQVGDVALAIGNPLGEQLPGTMTDGIISYIDRSVTVDGYEMQLIQTSAALNSGNSGGALLNEYGQVVGVTTLKMSSNWDTIEALGFAIPTATVKEIVDDLIAHGAVSGRPTIGITVCAVSALPPEEAEGLPQDGLYVVSVEEGSDALEQGLRAGDVILEANGTEVSTIEDLNDQKTGLSVGDALTLTVFRDGETFTVEIHLVEQYQLKG